MKYINGTLICVFAVIFMVGCKQQTTAQVSQNNYHSLHLKDSVFENVIEIEDKNIEQINSNYLINVSIPKSNKLPVIFVSARVPLDLLSSLYPEFPKLIVITPNWIYYDKVSKNSFLTKCAEPMASAVIYDFDRQNGTIKKDSLVLMGKFPEMKIIDKPIISSNQIEIYYTESYGSACCPRDQQWDNKPVLKDFITLFEKKNKVTITDTYKKRRGKEGEAIYYYPLKDLPNNLKLKFILEREYARIINRETKNRYEIKKIFCPYIIEIEDGLVNTKFQ